jgi:hypothetical protein
MRVSLVISPMSYSERDIEVPALPRVGDSIQLWSEEDDVKTLLFLVTAVLFVGRCSQEGEGPSELGVLVFCEEKTCV